jgi:hypothetical protein
MNQHIQPCNCSWNPKVIIDQHLQSSTAHAISICNLQVLIDQHLQSSSAQRSACTSFKCSCNQNLQLAINREWSSQDVCMPSRCICWKNSTWCFSHIARTIGLLHTRRIGSSWEDVSQQTEIQTCTHARREWRLERWERMMPVVRRWMS